MARGSERRSWWPLSSPAASLDLYSRCSTVTGSRACSVLRENRAVSNAELEGSQRAATVRSAVHVRIYFSACRED